MLLKSTFMLFIISFIIKTICIDLEAENGVISGKHFRSETEYFTSGSYTMRLFDREEYDGINPEWFFMDATPIPSGFEIKLHGRKVHINISRNTPEEILIKQNYRSPHLERNAEIKASFDKAKILSYFIDQIEDRDLIYSIVRVILTK